MSDNLPDLGVELAINNNNNDDNTKLFYNRCDNYNNTGATFYKNVPVNMDLIIDQNINYDEAILGNTVKNKLKILTASYYNNEDDKIDITNNLNELLYKEVKYNDFGENYINKGDESSIFIRRGYYDKVLNTNNNPKKYLDILFKFDNNSTENLSSGFSGSKLQYLIFLTPRNALFYTQNRFLMFRPNLVHINNYSYYSPQNIFYGYYRGFFIDTSKFTSYYKNTIGTEYQYMPPFKINNYFYGYVYDRFNGILYGGQGRQLKRAVYESGYVFKTLPMSFTDIYSDLPVLDSIESGKNILYSGDRLYPGDYLVSSRGRFSLQFQLDGNLVIYGPNGYVKGIWPSGFYNPYNFTTSGGPTPGEGWLELTEDGNLVFLYKGLTDPFGPTYLGWATGPKNSNYPFLILQTDGELCIYANDNTQNIKIWGSNSTINNIFIPAPQTTGAAYQWASIGTLRLNPPPPVYFNRYGSMNAKFRVVLKKGNAYSAPGNVVLTIIDSTFESPQIYYEFANNITTATDERIVLQRANVNSNYTDWTDVQLLSLTNQNSIIFSA